MRPIGLALLLFGLSPAIGHAQICTDIRANVCALKAFEPDPSATGTGAAGSPICDTAPANLTDQKNTVQAAFDLAPSKVKAALCQVTNIFIIESGTRHSWGRWENPSIHGSIPAKTQIAVNQADLGRSFSNKQDDHLSGLGLSAHGGHSETVPPQRIDPQALGLLYILAHELGHILWHRDNSSGNNPVACPGDPNFYSWEDISSTRTTRWTAFNASTSVAHKGKVPKPGNVNNSDDLKSIYTGGFVTALAAASPEEDFVETYAVRVLTEACPDCEFDIKIGSGGLLKVNDAGGNPTLRAKFDCVYNTYIKP